ncbi:MAG: hypothetical protein ABEJ68_11200 [Halobacteriaceae archaeon]
MERRDLLTFGSAVIPLLAGCTALEGGNGAPESATETATATATPTETATSTSTPTTTGEASVRDVLVTPFLVALTTADAVGTVGARDEQFVVASVAGTVAYEDFSLVAGDTTHAPEDIESNNFYRGVYLDRTSYPHESGTEGYVLFVLPKPLDVRSATLQWPGGEHALESAAIERLARPPTTFEVTEFTAPSSVSLGETATVSLTVENVGENTGTFVAGLNRSGPLVAYVPVASVYLDVDPGGTATWTHEYRATDDDAVGRAAEFKLRWRDGDRRTATIQIQE